jgi:PleD family two-component response regulator
MILIVDDHLDTGAMLARLLKGSGYDAVAVTSGKAALLMLPNVRADLVILDKCMPEQSGLEVLRTIRDDAVLRSIPVIMYSADDDPAEIVEAKRMGAQDYLVKGSTPWDVVRATVSRYADA